ncbi:MAG: hypothetical protein E7376_03190 [Clostridiales bacterium]|nr:hypothetical protein [Clostridiales bacterium]
MKIYDKVFYEGNKKLTRKEKKFLEKLFRNLSTLIENECKNAKEGQNREQRIRALEDNLLKVINQYPELLYVVRYDCYPAAGGFPTNYSIYGKSILFDIKTNGLNNLLKELAKDPEICKVTVSSNTCLLFKLIPDPPFSDIERSVKEYKKELDLFKEIYETNPELIYFQDQKGKSICHYILENDYNRYNKYIQDLEPYMLESLKSNSIVTYQDKNGNNLGMLFAKKGLQKLFNEAFSNQEARMQKNNSGETMEIIANNKGLIIPPLTDKQVYDFYNSIISKKIDKLCKEK